MNLPFHFGFENARRTLDGFVEEGDLPASLILHGPSVQGLEILSVWYAGRVNNADEGRMQRMLSNDDPDYERVLLSEDSLSIGVDEIRSVVDGMHLRPNSGRRRFCVVENAEKLTRKAQYALLKVSEEAPDESCLILLTDNLTELSSTLRSRFVRIRARLTDDELREHLLSEDYTDEQVNEAVAMARGDLTRVQEFLEGSFSEKRRAAARLILSAVVGRPHEYIEAVRDSEDVEQIANIMLELLVDLIAWTKGVQRLRHPSVEKVWQKICEDRDGAGLIPVVEEWSRRFEGNVVVDRQLCAMLSAVWRWSRE